MECYVTEATFSSLVQVKQSSEALANAGRGIVEMGGSMISGLKRGFSKTGESSGDQ